MPPRIGPTLLDPAGPKEATKSSESVGLLARPSTSAGARAWPYLMAVQPSHCLDDPRRRAATRDTTGIHYPRFLWTTNSSLDGERAFGLPARRGWSAHKPQVVTPRLSGH